MNAPRILVCGSQVPFASGGAEVLVRTLAERLARHGCEVDVVQLPFSWRTRVQVLQSALAWRLLDLAEVSGRPVDRVIATRFPSYAVAHPYKVVWLVHQFRQAYDLRGTPWSDFADSAEDRQAVAALRSLDTRTLGEAAGRYAISRNVAERLRRFNGLDAEALYPPPEHDGAYRCDGFGDYVFGVGRLDRLKRFDLLLRALPHTRRPVRCVIAGTGPEREALAALAERLGVAERVELPGWVDSDRLLELYAGCLAVFYAPYDEDYGYVTVEAFKSRKPVLTAADSGGVLELVEDGVSGYVVPAEGARRLAARLDELHAEPARARALGAAGERSVRGIGWERVLSRLAGLE